MKVVVVVEEKVREEVFSFLSSIFFFCHVPEFIQKIALTSSFIFLGDVGSGGSGNDGKMEKYEVGW